MADTQDRTVGGAQGTQQQEDRHGMSRAEAGRKGGETTARRHGHEFYAEIGRRGGQKSSGKFTPGSERAREAGRRGGEARRHAAA